MSVTLTLAYDHPQEVLALLSEYMEMLLENDPSFREYMQVQHYEDEIKDLTVKYGLPDGRLYLAWCEGKPAGCIGLRKLDKQRCEMKRLYVRPEFRGHKIGDLLIQKIMEDAREIGYTTLMLDTLPFLQNAIHMYQRYGFYERGSYNDSPMDTSIYMQYDL